MMEQQERQRWQSKRPQQQTTELNRRNISRRKRSREEVIGVLIMTDCIDDADHYHYQVETSYNCRHKIFQKSEKTALLIRSIGPILFWFCIINWSDSYVESFLFSGTSRNSPNNYIPIPAHLRYYQRNLQQCLSAASAAASASSSSSSTAVQIDLSRSFRNIFARNRNHHHRQRFVTGKFPLIVSVEENPNRKWLDLGRNQQQQDGDQGKKTQFSTLVVLVNGTNIDRSLASYDRYQWLDDPERQELHDRYATVSIELLAEINIDKPGYLQMLSSDGAGSSAARSRNIQQHTANDNTLWNRWKDDTTRNKEELIDERYCPDKPDKSSLRDRLWSTGFSLTSPHGFIKSFDIYDGHIGTVNLRSESMIPWPNEITKVPTNIIQRYDDSKSHVRHQYKHKQPFLHDSSDDEINGSFTQDALLVADGFLVPGKDRGGIYVVNNPGREQTEWSFPLTDPYSTDRWFYHKAIWVDLTGDGRLSILTARAKMRKVVSSTTGSDHCISSGDGSISSSAYGSSDAMEQGRPKNGQLIWLEMPKPHHFDAETGTQLEEDGTAFNPFNVRHLPWKEQVLATGPDVSFAVADMDPNDDTIEVLASQFFDEKVTLHSIQRGKSPKVTFTRVIDDKSGAGFGGILVDLDPTEKRKSNLVVDSGSTIKALNEGDSFSHFLVTSHEANYRNKVSEDNANNVMMTEYNDSNDKKQQMGQIRGGSLFAYKVPKGKNAWKTEPWIRTTIATGFQVKQQVWNVINPGAPGFAYAFHAHEDDESQGKRPMIAVAGDCAESAYIFRPQQSQVGGGELHTHQNTGSQCNTLSDPQAEYKLMCEIKCGATVGSIAVGYEDLCSAEQESGYAKVYIPCFEKDKILVFAFGSGEEDIIELDDGCW